MKSIIASALLVALGSTANAAQEITDPNFFISHDPKTSAEIYSWTRLLNEVGSNTPYLGFFVSRSADNAAGNPTIVVNVKTRQGLRPDCREPQWLADDEKMNPARRQDQSAKIPEQGVLDMMHSTFPIKDFLQIANAKTVKYSLCESVYTMTDTERRAFQTLINLHQGTAVLLAHPPHE